MTRYSNSYEAWKKMGSPQQPSPEQYAQLERAGQLQSLESPRWVESAGRPRAARFRSAAARSIADPVDLVGTLP